MQHETSHNATINGSQTNGFHGTEFFTDDALEELGFAHATKLKAEIQGFKSILREVFGHLTQHISPAEQLRQDEKILDLKEKTRTISRTRQAIKADIEELNDEIAYQQTQIQDIRVGKNGYPGLMHPAIYRIWQMVLGSVIILVLLLYANTFFQAYFANPILSVREAGGQGESVTYLFSLYRADALARAFEAGLLGFLVVVFAGAIAVAISIIGGELIHRGRKFAATVCTLLIIFADVFLAYQITQNRHLVEVLTGLRDGLNLSIAKILLSPELWLILGIGLIGHVCIVLLWDMVRDEMEQRKHLKHRQAEINVYNKEIESGEEKIGKLHHDVATCNQKIQTAKLILDGRIVEFDYAVSRLTAYTRGWLRAIERVRGGGKRDRKTAIDGYLNEFIAEVVVDNRKVRNA